MYVIRPIVSFPDEAIFLVRALTSAVLQLHRHDTASQAGAYFAGRCGTGSFIVSNQRQHGYASCGCSAHQLIGYPTKLHEPVHVPLALRRHVRHSVLFQQLHRGLGCNDLVRWHGR